MRAFSPSRVSVFADACAGLDRRITGISCGHLMRMRGFGAGRVEIRP